jgi:cyclic-di-AMP phosphodiesterase PgpH
LFRFSEKYRAIRDLLGKKYEQVARVFEGRPPEGFVPEGSVRRRKILARTVFNLLCAALVSGLLTIPSPNVEPVPLLTPGDISATDILAPVTAEVEPDARSKVRREDLAKRVAPIFDYDDTILNVWLSNWEQTFKAIRKEFYDGRPHAKNVDALFLDQLGTRVGELTGQALPVKDLLYLHQQQFSLPTEQAFVKVAKRLTGRLMAATDLFPSYYSTGIIVREVNRSLHETLIHDVSRIWSLDHAREFLNHVPTISPSDERDPVERIVQIVNKVVVPNLKFNATLTQKRIASFLGTVQPAMVAIKAGEVLVAKGERVSEDQAELLRKVSELMSPSSLWRQFIYQTLLAFVFFSVLFRLSVTRKAIYHLSLRDCIFFLCMTVLSIVFVKYPLPFLRSMLEVRSLNLKYGIEYVLPVSMGGIIIHLMMGREAAYTFAVCMGLILGQLVDTSFFYSIWTIGVTVAAIRSIRSCKQRTDLYRCGLWSGFVGSLLVLAHCMSLALGHQGLDLTALAISVGMSFMSGLIAAILTSALIPPLEALFGYTTSLKLLELSNFNHPLLHSLMMKAPGTYHHSVIVGSLAEIAADGIRANGLLARVAAYYHDIGKMNKPLYFIENQSPSDNPHDHLAPTMSAKILFSHVKSGVKLAREHNLGSKITDIIEQHHGTTLIAYFYNKAKKSERAEFDPVSEADFRYPGPRPQSREAAIVMLADACEAATRSIAEPTPSKIETMVHSIINRRFLEEQFNECDLTFADLKVIEQHFTRTLVSLYHHRIEYPGQKPAGPMSTGVPVTPLKKMG